jgi:hypothetical protein
MSTEPASIASQPSLDFEHWPSVTQVQTDRFCHNCGYNLHTQAIRREPRTQVLMIRCPECGTFHPASELGTRLAIWLRRLASVSIVLWVLIVSSLAVTVIGLQSAATYLTLDSLTENQWVTGPTGTVHERHPSPYLWANDRTWRLQLYATTGSMSLGLGLVATVIALVVVPHWRKFHHAVFIAIWALIAAGIVTGIWWSETVRMFHWGLPRIAAQAAVYILGGLVALIIGRPLIRLIGRICLPPRVRSVVERAWCWISQ